MVTIDQRAGKWLALALLASLSVNLFIGGIAVGRWIHGRSEVVTAVERPAARGRNPIAARLRRLTRNLDPQDRRVFRSAIREHEPALRATGGAVREARRALRRVVTAETLDRAALNAAFARLRARNADFQKALQGAIADGVARLRPEARRRLAD